MSISYFDNFDLVEYNNKQIQDIFKRIEFNVENMQSQNILEYHRIKDGEKPEDIAYQFYNDKTLYWLVLKTNSMQDYFYDWPLSDKELRLHMIEYYENQAEKIIDMAIQEYVKETTGTTYSEVLYTYSLDETETGYNPVLVADIDEYISTIQEKLYKLFYTRNDERKYINVVKSRYLNEVLDKVKAIK